MSRLLYDRKILLLLFFYPKKCYFGKHKDFESVFLFLSTQFY